MITINGKVYREIRCTECRKLMGYEYILMGRQCFICPRCGKTNEHIYKQYSRKHAKEEIQDGEFIVYCEYEEGR